MKSDIVKSARFIKASADYKDLGYDDHIEFAFIGRSNVGKSSLINALTGRKNLALISSMPGKTRTLNLFLINEKWTIVDLPGYGYAQRSKEEREKWAKSIKDYILNRKNLACLFILIDINIPPQKTDIEFINSCGENNIPLTILFTKADKSSKNKVTTNIEKFRKVLLEHWEFLPENFVTSARDMTGIEEVKRYIQKIINEVEAVRIARKV